MKRRVLVLNHFAASRDAPGGTRHVELFGRLQGWEARVIAPNCNYVTRRAARHDGELYRTVWTSPYSATSTSRILNWVSYGLTSFAAGLREARPDVVYASSPHLLAGLSGWALARLLGGRFVLEIRDLWPRLLSDMGQMSPSSVQYRSLSRLASFLYRHADAIVVMARGVETVLVEEEGVDPSRIRFIPNGADPDDFVPPPLPREELRAQYGLDGVVVTYTGAHGRANGLDLVLDAARDLQADLPEVRFLLVGDGS